MSKTIDFTETVYELCHADPEIIEIMKTLGCQIDRGGFGRGDLRDGAGADRRGNAGRRDPAAPRRSCRCLLIDRGLGTIHVTNATISSYNKKNP